VTASALSRLSPVPGQLAALCARLRASGHGITEPPARDLPEPWLSMLSHYDRGKTWATPTRDGCAAAAAVLPGLDGITLAILGLHTCQGRTVVRAHARYDQDRASGTDPWSAPARGRNPHHQAAGNKLDGQRGGCPDQFPVGLARQLRLGRDLDAPGLVTLEYGVAVGTTAQHSPAHPWPPEQPGRREDPHVEQAVVRPGLREQDEPAGQQADVPDHHAPGQAAHGLAAVEAILK